MPIFEKQKTIFIHIPKTAGTSITKKFLPNFKGFKHHDFIFYKNLLKDKISDYKFFTVVRNPYDRIVSYFNMHMTYSFLIKEKIAKFNPKNIQEAFKIYINLTVKEQMTSNLNKPFLVNKSQSSYLVDNNNILNKEIHIIKYENLNNEIAYLPRENVGKHNFSSLILYSEESKKFIKNYFIDDFLNFEYND
jgi:hypothetical protein